MKRCCRCGVALRDEDLVPAPRHGYQCKAVATCRWRRQSIFDARQLGFDFEV